MNAIKLVLVDAPGARGIFERWLTRGDGVGVFTNADLGHYDLGRMVFVPVAAESVEIGTTRAPDGPHGLGWRYVLTRVVTTLDAFEFVG